VALWLAAALVAGGVAGGVVAGVVESTSGPTTVVSPATGPYETAERLGPPGCRQVVIIGDSLTIGAEPHHRAEMTAAGQEGVVDGRVSRRVGVTSDPTLSGILTAQRLREDWNDADCWVIGLGNNDIYVNATDVARSAAIIDQQVAAIPERARIWWINISDTRTPTSVARAAAFNQALADRASRDPGFEVVDWASLLAANPGWSTDGVHVVTTGYRARAALVADALVP
jgi:lysophospholipase L1-like esterase